MEGSLPKHWHRIRFSYDRNNRLIRGWDDFGAEVRYDYDCLGNLTLEEQVIQEGIRRRVRYSYNKNGWRVKREETIQGNGETTSAVTGYEYDKSGNVTVIKTPNGFEIRRDYDADGQMTKERIIDKSNGIDRILAQAYDAAGNLVRETVEGREGESLQTEYGYDLKDRKIHEQSPMGGITRLADNDYGTSDVRTWLNQYFADTLSVAGELAAVRLPETGDSVSDKVFCLSINEVKNPDYKEIARKMWTPRRGMRYYWTRSKRENTTNQAYLVQYNGHIASSRVSLTEAGIRPAFVLGREKADTGQGKIWYEGDTQERVIHGKSYTFRCVDPNYCDAGMNRAGALFLCDSIIGGNESMFDENHNGWEASDLRGWLLEGLADSEGIARAETTTGYTYAGKSSDYMISERKFTKRRQPGNKTEDVLFCLSLEEAIRYGNYLWKLDGSETDNFTLAGSHAMGYWLRTPAARDGKMCYAVTYDGRVAPEQVDNDRIGNRPAFVAVQE